MIPVRVHLRDFLCYDHGMDNAPITFDFEGSRLWSISGDNGAGKSAIFDAIRYALYGQHRDGSQRDARLIRRGAQSCEVTFEFRSDGRLYRVRRTVGRAKGKSPIEPKTWQAAVHDETENAWVPLPGTDQKDGLDAWVEERLGLSYKTFIASVLLLQGESDQLTRATSKERFEILSGLLSLEAYEHLAASARDRGKLHRSEADQLEAKLVDQPAVRPEDLDNAAQLVSRTDEELGSAQEAVSKAAEVIAAAKGYQAVVAELAMLRNSLRQVEAQLASEPAIRADYAAWSSLSEQVPRMRQALTAVRHALAKEREATSTSKEAVAIDLSRLQAIANSAESAENAASDALREAGAVLETCDTAVEALRPRLAILDHHEAATKRVADLTKELAGLRAQLAALTGLEESCAEGRRYREALPLIKLIRERQSALVMRQSKLAKVGTVASAESNVAVLTKTVADAEGKRKLADHERTTSARVLARAEQQHQTVRVELGAREQAKNDAVCSRCGQPVPAQHIKLELARARAKVVEVTAELRDAKTIDLAAGKGATAAVSELEGARAKLGTAVTKLAEAKACAVELRAAKTGLAVVEGEAKAAADDVRALVRDGTLAKPLVSVSEMEKKVGALPKLERELEAFRALEGRADGIDGQTTRERAGLQDLEKQFLPDERQQLRRHAAALERDHAGARTKRDAAQVATAARQNELKRARDALQAGRERRSRLETAARELSQGADGLRVQAKLRLEGIEPTVRDGVLLGDEAAVRIAETRLLTLTNAKSAFDDLVYASNRRLAIAGKVEATAEQLERINPEHRVPLVEAEALQIEAASRFATAQLLRDEARGNSIALRAKAELRQGLEAQHAATRRRTTLYGRLADLLGRTGLQAVLMDEAIAGISRLSNETLNRISGGQLQLLLARETTGRGEDIKIQATDLGSSDDPLDIAFLSGSQKFRVAVALAAGIGQYAAGAGRIRALIIDEGFGSLDAQGRQEMVDELHALAGMLERVIVVSHQEDFQDRTLFSTGYVLHKSHQRTEVLRYV